MKTVEKRAAAAIVGLALSLGIALGCGSTSPAAQSAQDQQTAAAAVTVLNDAWKFAAQMCSAAGDAGAPGCGPLLYQAYVYIESAASAVDSWGNVNQSNYQCAVGNAVQALTQAMAALKVSPLPPLVQSAVTVARLVGACPAMAPPVDAGAQ